MSQRQQSNAVRVEQRYRSLMRFLYDAFGYPYDSFATVPFPAECVDDYVAMLIEYDELMGETYDSEEERSEIASFYRELIEKGGAF